MFPLQSGTPQGKTYIEDVFSAYTYTGTAASLSITNGVDLSTHGGLVWFKNRSILSQHGLYDTARGVTKELQSSTTNAQGTEAQGLTAFGSTGFTVGSRDVVNGSGNSIVSWSFRKAAKFFDVVTWTGNGSSTQTISHSLGQAPGMIIAKRTDNTGAWAVYHRSTTTPNNYYLVLNTTAAEANAAQNLWNASSASFTASSDYLSLNVTGATYVAYLFAHDTGTDGLIQCGSFTSPGSGDSVVTLGWEPQLILFKASTGAAQAWTMFDTARGMSYQAGKELLPNSSAAEADGWTVKPTATGFSAGVSASRDYIYMAIRRGPMRFPTSGTQVYQAIARTGTGAAATVTGVGFAPDLLLHKWRASAGGFETTAYDRLRGRNAFLNAMATAAESVVGTSTHDFVEFIPDGAKFGVNTSTTLNANSETEINWFFRRYPGVFDEVCWTSAGGGTSTLIPHNLGVVPEMYIVKSRTIAGSTWYVYTATHGRGNYLKLHATDAVTTSANRFGTSGPSATQFGLDELNSVGAAGETAVAYLFATLAGISKVGSYTGTGTTLQVNCGFAAGARFVLIKRTDSTGDWYVWDSVRGIVSGNDPYLLLNSTAAEATGNDYIDPYSAGFEISSTAPAAINASGGTFVYLAFA